MSYGPDGDGDMKVKRQRDGRELQWFQAADLAAPKRFAVFSAPYDLLESAAHALHA